MERGRPLPGLGLGWAGVAASALFAVLLGGCDSGGVDGTPAAWASASPTVEATEAAIRATDTPSPPPTPSPARDVYAYVAAGNGILSLDPITGEVTEVWAGPERIWLPGIYAGLAARGDGVWLSWDGSEESVRYDLEGNEVDRVPGLFPTESPDGTVVAYLSEPYGPGSTLVVRDARYGTRDLEMDGGSAAPHDDGRVAFLSRFGGNDEAMLYLYEPSTGRARPLAVTARPGKEGVIYPVWSPSGRFVSDWSSSPVPGERGHGILIDSHTGEVTGSPEPYVWVEGPDGEDWHLRSDDGALVLTDAATGSETVRITSDAGPLLPGSDLGGALLARIGVQDSNGGTRSTGVIVFDLEGNELARWEGRTWYPTMTPSGPAAHYVDEHSRSDCPAGKVDHPDFEGDLDCVGHEQAWSPDGRFLAMKALVGDREWLLVLDTQTEETLTVDVRSGFGFEWSRDSTKILLRIGGGL